MGTWKNEQIRAKSSENHATSTRGRSARKSVSRSLPGTPLPDVQAQPGNAARLSYSLAHLPIFPPTSTGEYDLPSSQQANPEAAMNAATAGGASELPYRAEMERAFHEDFSTVKSHPGQSIKIGPLGAYAASRGEDIVFAGTHPGRKEVAHELVHVVQNRRKGVPAGHSSSVTASDHPAEREAERLAFQVAAGSSVVVTAQPEGAISLGKYKVGNEVRIKDDGRTGKITQLLSGNRYKIKLKNNKAEEVDEDEIELVGGGAEEQGSTVKPAPPPSSYQKSLVKSTEEEEASASEQEEEGGSGSEVEKEREEKPSGAKEKQSKYATKAALRKKGIGEHALRGHVDLGQDDNALRGQAKEGKSNFRWASEERLVAAFEKAKQIKKPDQKAVEVDISPEDGYGIRYDKQTETYSKIYPKKARVVFMQRGDFKTAYGITKPDEKSYALHREEEIE